jgi:hypothetical protein
VTNTALGFLVAVRFKILDEIFITVLAGAAPFGKSLNNAKPAGRLKKQLAHLTHKLNAPCKNSSN